MELSLPNAHCVEQLVFFVTEVVAVAARVPASAVAAALSVAEFTNAHPPVAELV